jgi:hypothetical protein
MPTPYGTMTTIDSLRYSQSTVLNFGEDRVYDAVQREIDALNAQIAEATGAFVERTQDKLRRYGATTNMQMKPVGQGGIPPVQKAGIPANNLGFPLYNFALGIQWTKIAFKRLTVREVARQTDAATTADKRRVMYEFKNALFLPTNRTVRDELTEESALDIPVKALLNADGMTIPNGPDNEVFDGTVHTHYLFTAAFIAANLSSLIDTVVEHFADGEVQVYINRAQAPTVRGFTGFVPYDDARLLNRQTTLQAGPGGNLFRLNNQPIGYFGAAEVWIKPWVPANYVVCLNIGSTDKVLAWRTYDQGSGNFGLVFQDENFPLRADFFAREFGIGANARHGAAVLYTGGGAYVAPTLVL